MLSNMGGVWRNREGVWRKRGSTAIHRGIRNGAMYEGVVRGSCSRGGVIERTTDSFPSQHHLNRVPIH